MQSLGKIVQRAPAVGAKMWCLFVLFLLTCQKSGFSPRRGDSLNRFRSNFAGPTGIRVRLALQNFMSIGAEACECAPKYQNFPLFGKESPPRGDSLDRFRKFIGAFIRLTPSLMFQISYDSRHRLRSYCGETARW